MRCRSNSRRSPCSGSLLVQGAAACRCWAGWVQPQQQQAAGAATAWWGWMGHLCRSGALAAQPERNMGQAACGPAGFASIRPSTSRPLGPAKLPAWAGMSTLAHL